MLTTADIASMRNVAELALPGTAIIQSKSVVSDGGGGGSVTWTASGTVDCRIDPISGDERNVSDRIAAEAKWVVTMPAETDVTTKCRLVIDSTNYNVLALRSPRSFEITTRAEVGEEV